jgi:DNA-binding MarR family transcriptional regulator
MDYLATVELTNLPRMTASSRKVFEAISRIKISTLNELTQDTGLPTRTVQLALKTLIELKLVNVRTCLNDARRKFYCYSKSME